MPLTPQGEFTFKHANQADTPNVSASTLKSQWDTQANELKTTLNNLIIALEKTTATSGAEQIGSLSIADINGTTIHAQLVSLRDKLKSIVDGSSGADFINATAISGLTGGTVQALLEALKTNVDSHKNSSTLDHPDSSVTSAKLANLSVLTTKLADLAVSTAKIADSAVTTAKINNLAVTTDKLADSGITTDKIADESVTTAKIAVGALDGRYFTESELQATTTDSSGAHKIGGASINGISAGTLYSQLVALKSAIDDTVLGQIPDSSLTDVKLSDAAGQIKDRVTTINSKINDYDTQESTIERGLQTILTDQETPVWIKSILGCTVVNHVPELEVWDAVGGANIATTGDKHYFETGDLSNTVYFEYAIPVEQNTDYTISGKLASITGANNARLDIYDSANSTVLKTAFLSTSTTLTEFAETFNTASNTKIFIRLTQVTSGSSGGGVKGQEIMLNVGATAQGFVANMKPLSGVYLRRQGKQMLPPFTEWTTVNANAEIINPYELKLTATSDDQYSEIYMPCISDQSYTLNLTTDGRVTVRFLNKGSIVATYGNVTLPFTVTSPIDATSINILITNSTLGAGTYMFTEPMLSLGSTALPFEVQNDDYTYIETPIRSNVEQTVRDTVYEIDGQLRKVKRFEYVELDGSLDWSFVDDFAGFKRIQVSGVMPNTLVSPTNSIAVKYDGKILAQADSTIARDRYSSRGSAGNYWIAFSIADTDSGWGEDYSPTDAEVQAYVWGWKMYEAASGRDSVYNGTGIKQWIRITRMADVEATGSDAVASVPTYYAGEDTLGNVYKPHQLQYQRATEADEPVTAEVGLSLFDGLNAVELGEGMIVRELANPVKGTGANTNTLYFINVLGSGTSGSLTVPSGGELDNRTSKIIKVYKNGVEDKSWTITVSNSIPAYGNERVSIHEADYDPTAVYTVTYIAEPGQISANVIDAQIEYATNLKTVVGRNVQDIADAKRDISVIEGDIERRLLKGEGERIETIYGSATVATAGSRVTSTITFGTAFSEVPKVKITLRDISVGDSGYVTMRTAKTETTTGVTIYVNSYVAQTVDFIVEVIGK